MLWGISRRFHRLYPGDGHVAHALRTLSPVAARSIATPALPLDLHVLSLPLAFILSQDQTLLCIYTYKILVRSRQLISYQKKSTLSFLFSVLFACTSFSLFNELSNAFFKSGCKGSPFSETTKFFLRKVINNSGRKKFISIIRNEKSAPFPERSIYSIGYSCYIPARTMRERPTMKKRNIRPRRVYTFLPEPLNSFHTNTPQIAAIIGAPCPRA